MDFELELYKVYIQVDSKQRITAITSSRFLKDLTDWILVDEGAGDKYHHAQNHYLSKSLRSYEGFYNYKFVDNQIIERSDEEKEKDSMPLVPAENLSERLDALESLLAQYEVAYAEGVNAE